MQEKVLLQDSVNAISSNISQEAHLLNSMGHCQKISNKHHTGRDAYSREIPQIILQNVIDPECALSIIADQRVPPALENDFLPDLYPLH